MYKVVEIKSNKVVLETKKKIDVELFFDMVDITEYQIYLNGILISK
jgi:hypothetical protein